MKRASWLALELEADTISAQDEKDAILDLHSILLSLQNKHKLGSNVADRSEQFQTTLHYIVGAQEKEMEYMHRVHWFSTFVETLNNLYFLFLVTMNFVYSDSDFR